MHSRGLALPSAGFVRALVDELTGVCHDVAQIDATTFDALGLDVMGRIELGARLAAACNVPAPIDVMADGSATTSDLIAVIVAEQLDLELPHYSGG